MDTQRVKELINKVAQEANYQLTTLEVDNNRLKRCIDRKDSYIKKLEERLELEISDKKRAVKVSDDSMLWMLASWICFAAYFAGSMLDL